MSLRSTISKLVMQKYGNKLKEQIQKGLKRRQKRTLGIHYHQLNTSSISNLTSSHANYEDMSTLGLSDLQSNLQDNYVNLQHEENSENPTYQRENRTFFENSTVEGLFQKISIQSEMILQILKALHFAYQREGFHLSPQHLEIERLLLIESFRKELLMQELLDVEYSEIRQFENGCVTVRNLKFLAETSDNTRKKRCFLCLIQNSSDLRCSSIVEDNKEGEINFEEEFVFENLPPNFEIRAHLFCMDLQTKKVQANYSLSPFVQRPSMFKYWGKCIINRTNMKSTKFSTEIHSHPVMAVSLESAIQHRFEHSGFVTIGKSRKVLPTWNERWCVIEDGKLKYWNHPGDAKNCAPLKIVNLMDCQSFGVAKKEVCGRGRCLSMELPNDEIYFLSFHSTEEFEYWKNIIKMTLCSFKAFT